LEQPVELLVERPVELPVERPVVQRLGRAVEHFAVYLAVEVAVDLKPLGHQLEAGPQELEP
jgi:hypothetical protein